VGGFDGLAGSDFREVGKGVVFIDFGRNKVYALTDNSEAVMVFDSIMELAKKLWPIVLDSLPGRQQSAEAEMVRSGVTFLKLKVLKKLYEGRGNNGIRKSNENDVVVLRTLFHQYTQDFQPLYAGLEELTVRALTELWVQMVSLKKSSKQARRATVNPLAVEIRRKHMRVVKRLSDEIHGEALKLPLCRLADEKLGLRGPALAYIISHDGWFKALDGDILQVRYQLFPRKHGRNQRSRLLIMLANTAVLNNHPRYGQSSRNTLKIPRTKIRPLESCTENCKKNTERLRLLANGPEP